MTGRWKCTDAGGEWDAVLAELGFGFFGRKALQATGYGKDQLFRSFQHNGPHVRMIDHVHGLPDTVYEFEIGKQQLVNEALQVSYWDVERPQILRWKRAEETEGPRKWIANCAFLLGTDQLLYVLRPLLQLTRLPGGRLTVRQLDFLQQLLGFIAQRVCCWGS